ncbi:hypothetical protein DOTSEDRAFT_40978 [Dothistroma septosporum NZE10]|uniref:A-kinase anchor protein 7-like phosphoesterase domain-containing protein n=1 Tax=Dothistroma septosporum (strain NZE10 / CBS 128990) TaxID=675120 RepID=N1Q3M2_DOTSN|nr:hypothetical protein DOTSEDRAFT_40978 [Dothistroma septosporum NZE10]
MDNGRGPKGGSAKKPPLTHFLCLPLVTETSRPQLEQSLKQFRDAVSPTPQDATKETQGEAPSEAQVATMAYIHPKAIRPVGALHCTLGVMSLKQEQLEAATTCLKTLDLTAILQVQGQGTPGTAAAPDTGHPSLQRPISPSPIKPLKIDLKGLDSMHSPDKTSILYAVPIDHSDRLYPFCLAVQKMFKEKGFLLDDDRKLKLHATIVNTIYAKGRKHRTRACRAAIPQASTCAGSTEQGHGTSVDAPLKIDARSLLELHVDFVWAEHVVLDRVAICEMGAKKSLDASGNEVDERYIEVASVPLPTCD